MYGFFVYHAEQLENFVKRSIVLFKQKKQEFKDYIDTGVTFVNPADAREQSVKAVYATTYDRYTAKDKHGNLKYHKEPEQTEGN